ncbi:MAG: site-2 protease family protein [Gemmatimonadales bacterium]
MFGTRIELLRLFGIPIRLDLSWFVVALLIAWSLATGLFPQVAPGLSPRAYWVMGVTGALGLFASILLHEFSHAWVARRHAIPIEGITLFIFGGVAEMGGEPPSPKAEFRMAAAGPVVSIVLGGLLLGLTALLDGGPPLISGVLGYLGFINLVLAAFNLVPAFPLDGGRILRSALWHWKQDLRWATRIAARLGTGFSVVLMLLGVVRVVSGDFVGGMWSFLIGMFLRQASQGAYQAALARKALEGEPVRRFMTRDPVSLPAGLTLGDAVDQYFYRYHHKLFPVTDDGRLLGCISTDELKRVPREQWSQQTVGSVVVPCSARNAVSPDTDALQALALMRRTGAPHLLVVDADRLAGVVTLKDLLEFFALKVELEP